MQNVLSIYQTEGVKDVCPKCASWANAELDAIRKTQAPELKARIRAKMVKAPPNLSWWRRFFS